MGGARAVQDRCVPRAVEEDIICSHLTDEVVVAHNGFVVGDARENSLSILDPAGGSAIQIDDVQYSFRNHVQNLLSKEGRVDPPMWNSSPRLANVFPEATRRMDAPIMRHNGIFLSSW